MTPQDPHEVPPAGASEPGESVSAPGAPGATGGAAPVEPGAAETLAPATEAAPPEEASGAAAVAARKGGWGPIGWFRRLGPWWKTAIVLGVFSPFIVIAGLLGFLYAATSVPLPSKLPNPQVSVIEFANGHELGRVGAQNRVEVPLSKISKDAQHAVLAAEDRNYYQEPGISYKGILRAVYHDVKGDGGLQGGSTITQQYAKNAYLTQERTFTRKLKEVALAVKLDRTYSKDQVLTYYLNTVYFGRGAYGIETASETYFGIPAEKLDAGQAAVLASLLRSPSGYDPAAHPEAALKRWKYVLDGMSKSGWLDASVAMNATYPRVLPRSTGKNQLSGTNGYLTVQVEEELSAKGIDEQQLGSAGLRVITTVDEKAQAAAVRSVEQNLGGKGTPPGLHRALVSLQPGTGRVIAEYGGSDYVTRPFNDATQGTAQAGSSFKPYVLTAALSQGISLKTQYDGRSPQQFGTYKVSNFGPGNGEQFGKIDLAMATAHSVNTVYVPLGLQAGLDKVAQTAKTLGVTSDLSRDQNVPSFSLGVTSVHPLDQAIAYNTFAGKGKRAAPYLVEKVLDAHGHVLYAAHPEAQQVLDPKVDADVTFALQAVVQQGTAQAAQLPGRPVAGKTGTTSGNTAAWFVGYTPQLTTAVALYSDNPKTPLRGINGVNEVTGGTLPAKTWHDYMLAALEGQKVLPFDPPAFVGAVPTMSPVPTLPSVSVAPLPNVSFTPSPSASSAPINVPTLVPTLAPTSSAPSPSATPSPTASATPSPTASASGRSQSTPGAAPTG